MAHSGANGGWAWVQNLALVEIADEGRVSGLKRMLARSVYLALCQLDNGHAEGPKGVVIASQATLAKYACCDRRSIPSGVTELERAGVISVTRRTKPGQKCAEVNEYRLLAVGSNPAVTAKVRPAQGGEATAQGGEATAQGGEATAQGGEATAQGVVNGGCTDKSKEAKEHTKEINTPSLPIGGHGRAENPKKIQPPQCEEAIRLGKLFCRRTATDWEEKEVKVLKKLMPIQIEDLDLLERYYAAERAKGKDGHHRRDLSTLLNNFSGELDRARIWSAPRANKSDRRSQPW
jgi:hypothetical protein